MIDVTLPEKINALIDNIIAFIDESIPFLNLSGDGGIFGGGKKGIEQKTIPEEGDWTDDYDMYGGLGISIDFNE